MNPDWGWGLGVWNSSFLLPWGRNQINQPEGPQTPSGMLIPSHAAESLLTLTLTVSFLLCEMGTALWLPVFESTGGGSSVVLVPLLTPKHTHTQGSQVSENLVVILVGWGRVPNWTAIPKVNLFSSYDPARGRRLERCGMHTTANCWMSTALSAARKSTCLTTWKPG